MLLAAAGLFGVFFFLTYYMQLTLGFSPLITGLAFLPMTGLLVATSVTAQTRVLPRTGAKPLVMTGMTLGVIAMVVFTRLSPGGAYATHVLPGLLVIGVGMGCIFAPAIGTATLGVASPRDRRGLGDGQHLPAGRRRRWARAAEHGLGERRG